MTDEKILKILTKNYKRFLKIRNEIIEKKGKSSFSDYQKLLENIVNCCNSNVSAIFDVKELQEKKK